MKKLLIVTDAWRPQVNGVVTVFSKILELAPKRDYEVTLIEPSTFMTLPLPFYPEIRLAVFPGQQVKEKIAVYKPDAIHIATEGPLGLATRRYCVRHKIPFTTSFHTRFELYLEARLGALVRRPVFAFLRWFHNASVRTLVATKSLEKQLENEGFTHLMLWPLGVDTTLFTKSHSAPMASLPTPVFVYLGRIAEEKNVEDFLRLDLPGSKLVIGDGPDRTALEKKYGGGTTIFVGYQRGVALAQWLSRGSVLVFPSRTDTFGLVIIEALACGLPVAAYPVMGPQDIITQGVDGYLSDDLQEAALKCLTLPIDACRTKALAYSWDTSVDIFLQNLEVNS